MDAPVELADPLLAEGTRIGDFQIHRMLGEGAMGRVYLAHDITLGRRIALKLIKRSAMQSGGVERFLEEARATASFNHPHIVTLHAVGEHDGRPYLALEYIDGESLRARLVAGPLPLREALRYCRAVADAIAEAHRRGVVHADLKPENIVIASDGRVRVVDFGLARLAGDTPNAMSGTPAYMAPERWRGLPPTGAIDIWALGVTLHELVTGDRPIGDYELPHLSFMSDRLELAGLPVAPWAQLVRDCLVFSPEARPTADEVVHRITALLEPHGSSTADDVRARWAIGSKTRYAITELAAGAAPGRQLRLMFSARNAGPPGDAWLVPVVERMMRRSFRDRQDRRFNVVAQGADATRIELVILRADEQLRIEAQNGSEGRTLAAASAATVASAVQALASILAGELGAGLGPAGPDADELEAMHRIGATSVDLFRRYRRVLHALCATGFPDPRDLAAATHEIIADDPEWAHPYALLVVIEGQTTEAARAAVAEARSAASAIRDPSGMKLIDTLDPDARDPETAFDVVEEVFRQNDSDLLAGLVLGLWATLVHRTEEVMAVTQHFHARFPDLGFGMALAEWLRRESREADADRVIRDWVAAAPDNLVARIELVRIEANAGRLAEARARAREVLDLYGDRDDALPDLFEALVASDQISEARAIADRMLAGSPLVRARGRYRVAMTSVFEGRFAAAYNAVRRAITEHRAFGMQSELTQCLELARSIAPLVADVAAQRRYAEELAAAFAAIPDPVAAAATRFELALLEGRRAAPSIDDHLAGLEDGPVRDAARRRMLRAAAVAGCGSPHVAVAAGFSAFEDNTASLVALGLSAWRVHELELARRSLEQATRRWSSGQDNNQNSPYHAVLARFHLGGVLTQLGEHAAARAAYEAFLRCWASPDRPIPEVARARKMLEDPLAGR